MHFWDRMAWGVSSSSHKTIDMNTCLLSQKLVLGGTILKKGKFQSKYTVALTQLKKNISIIKTHWWAQGLRKVQVEPGVLIATQNFKRHLQPISCIWRHLAFFPVTLLLLLHLSSWQPLILSLTLQTSLPIVELYKLPVTAGFSFCLGWGFWDSYMLLCVSVLCEI